MHRIGIVHKTEILQYVHQHDCDCLNNSLKCIFFLIALYFYTKNKKKEID